MNPGGLWHHQLRSLPPVLFRYPSGLLQRADGRSWRPPLARQQRAAVGQRSVAQVARVSGEAAQNDGGGVGERPGVAGPGGDDGWGLRG